MWFHENVAQRGLNPEYNRWDDLITAQAGGDANLAALIKAVIAAESSWAPGIVGGDGRSMGLMQIYYGQGGPYPTMTQDQLLDPSTNIVLGSNFLKSLLYRYGESDAIASYNAGSPTKNPDGAYTNSQGDTVVQDYVDTVQTYHVWYINNWPSEALPSEPVSDIPTVTPGQDNGRDGGSPASGNKWGWVLLVLGGLYAAKKAHWL